MKCTAPINSKLNVKLRGAGLNLELTGELIWIGATQKEVGIHFQLPSAGAQRDIANWVTQQGQARVVPASAEPSPLKPMPPMPGVFGSRDYSSTHSLSTALGMSQTPAQDSEASLGADEDESELTTQADSERDAIQASPRLEIVPPIRENVRQIIREIPDAPAASAESSELSATVGDHAAAASEAPNPPEVEEIWRSLSRLELPPVTDTPDTPDNPETADATPTEPISAVEPEPVPPVAEVPAAPSAPPVDSTQIVSDAPKHAAAKTVEINRPPQPAGPRLPAQPEEVSAVAAVEQWIPPALLAAWKSGTSQHKLFLAAAGVVCVGLFVAVLTLAVIHVPGSASHSQASGTRQQPASQQTLPAQTESQTPASASAAPNGAANSVQTASPQQAKQSPATAPAGAARHSSPPEQPSLTDLARSLIGLSPENSGVMEINDDQLRVQVWTSKGSGYYYCTDDSFYKNVNPGTFMLQGDALQSGYRPILGQFCN